MTDDAEFALPAEISLSRATAGLTTQLALKRAFDIVAAFVLLLLLSPVLVLAALAVRLTSHGPALFRQKRWGRNGSQFECLKFRTMHVAQDSLVDPSAIRELEAKGILFKPRNDPRVTRVGAFLRKTSIDELPQLFNVLAGDMSLVGPRPLMLHMLQPYPELRGARGQMRPGITGLWQISARESNETALQMARYDLGYIRDFSLWADFRILLHTPATVLFGKGAH